MFEGVTKKLGFETTKTHAFANRNGLLCDERTA